MRALARRIRMERLTRGASGYIELEVTLWVTEEELDAECFGLYQPGEPVNCYLIIEPVSRTRQRDKDNKYPKRKIIMPGGDK